MVQVDYGGCPNGIFSAACPVKPLHALENGLRTTCLKIIFDEMLHSNSTKAQLDALVKALTTLPSQYYASSGAWKEMPRLLWKDGIRIKCKCKNWNHVYHCCTWIDGHRQKVF